MSEELKEQSYYEYEIHSEEDYIRDVMREHLLLRCHKENLCMTT